MQINTFFVLGILTGHMFLNRIWGTYFDEIPPHDETHDLLRPNTLKYLMKSSIGSSRGHYIFPYFLAIRPVCEEGFYDDNVYKVILVTLLLLIIDPAYVETPSNYAPF